MPLRLLPHTIAAPSPIPLRHPPQYHCGALPHTIAASHSPLLSPLGGRHCAKSLSQGGGWRGLGLSLIVHCGGLYLRTELLDFYKKTVAPFRGPQRLISLIVIKPVMTGFISDYSASLPSEPSTSTILWMYIFFMFSRAGFRY